MSSSITLIALSAAAGLVLGWFLCHLAHTTVRSDARHYREEADLLRTKAIRIDEHRLTAQSEAVALYRQLEDLRHAVEINADIDLDAVDEAIDLAESERADEMHPPARPASSRGDGEPGRLAEAFGSD